MALRFVITGTGRCGTGFMAQVFLSAGVNCGHEAIFRHNSCDASLEWMEMQPEFEADSSWMAAPCLGMPELENATIIHLVRHPKKVIDSYVRMGFFNDPNVVGYVRYMHNALPILHKYDDPIHKAGALYLGWNGMIEPWAHWLHRVEDEPYPFLDKLGIECDEDKLFNNTRHNHRAGPETDTTLADFPGRLGDALHRMARRYGYDGH